ncbi:MAG: M23 family metallopeptidase [Candidatus Gribaldobacteria bacterium]|nr:M23 family metallopeptidase [Candidatus Gribaldobacteria bacterium]
MENIQNFFQRRSKLTPLFSLLLIGLCLIVLGVAFIGGKKMADQKRNVFSQEHFLFADSNQATKLSDLSVTENSVLSSQAPSFLVDSAEGTASSNEPFEYKVVKGDTLKSLAGKFSISIETIAWANDLSAKAILRAGQTLLILPVSGVLHMVKKGNTLSGLAELYKVSAQEIIDFNEIADGSAITVGDLLVIPGGKKPKVAQPSYATVPLSQSYFICPVPTPVKVTQGSHWFNAVDFANGNCGDPVFAAAGGEVQKVAVGTNSGKYLTILHPNGAVTYYGHLSSISVSLGDKVSQGQIIGLIGHTGNTIPAGEAGCHLHFDVRFASNPFTRYAVGSTISK